MKIAMDILINFLILAGWPSFRTLVLKIILDNI